MLGSFLTPGFFLSLAGALSSLVVLGICRVLPLRWFGPRDYLKPAREAAKKICLARYEAFGCAGQASKIKVIPLEKMAVRYAKGELNQIVK